MHIVNRPWHGWLGYLLQKKESLLIRYTPYLIKILITLLWYKESSKDGKNCVQFVERLQFLSGESSGDPLVLALITMYQNDPETMLNHTREVEIHGVDYQMVLETLNRLQNSLFSSMALAMP